MQSIQVRHYIERATDFFDSMLLIKDEPDLQNSSALLAIHSAIAYTDALREGLGDSHLSSDDHNRAVTALQTLLVQQRIEDQSGLRHLQYLLGRKSAVAYGRNRLDGAYYTALFTKADRFASWANNLARSLNIEGWQHGDH